MPASVQQTVWNWCESGGGPAGSGGISAHGRLRRQALIQALVMGAIGAALRFWLHHELFATIVWALAGVILVLGLAAPPAYRPVHRFGQWLGGMIGRLLTVLLLVPVFYLIFFPVSLWLRLRGRDPLHREARDRRYTCWIPRRRPAPVESYARQFLLEDREAVGMLRPVATDSSANAVAPEAGEQ